MPRKYKRVLMDYTFTTEASILGCKEQCSLYGKVMIVAVGGGKSHWKLGRQFENGTKCRANESNIEIYQEKILDPVKFWYKVMF